MHFKMSSAICFNLDKSKILLSGNGLRNLALFSVNNESQKQYLSKILNDK